MLQEPSTYTEGNRPAAGFKVTILIHAVIQLEFGAVSYTFSEDSSDAVISIVIANYDEVVIENTVSVTVIVEDPGNTTVSGMWRNPCH